MGGVFSRSRRQNPQPLIENEEKEDDHLPLHKDDTDLATPALSPSLELNSEQSAERLLGTRALDMPSCLEIMPTPFTSASRYHGSRSLNTVSDQTPQLCDLVIELKMVDWYRLGVQLEVPTDKLDKIEEDYRSQSEKQLTKVLDYWLLNEPNPTWDKICEVLRKMGGFGRIVCDLTVKYRSLSALRSMTTCQQQHVCRRNYVNSEAASSSTCEVDCSIQEAIDTLQGDFRQCVTIIRLSFETVSDAVSGIKESLKELPAGEVKGQVGLLLTQSDNLRIVMNSDNIDELFMNLSNIRAWDFLHPQLLEYLVWVLGKDEAKRSMMEYMSKLVQFRESTKMRKLLGWFGNIPKKSSFQKTVMILGDKWKDKTYQEFEVLRISLLRRRVFDQSCLSLCGVLNGSVMVILAIPKLVNVVALKKMFEEPEIQIILLDNQVQSIYVEELCLIREVCPGDANLMYSIQETQYPDNSWKVCHGTCQYTYTRIPIQVESMRESYEHRINELERMAQLQHTQQLQLEESIRLLEQQLQEATMSARSEPTA